MSNRRRRAIPAGFGIVLFLLGFPALWMNEGAAVRDRAAILSMEQAAVAVDHSAPRPLQDGEIIVLSGAPVTTEASLTDPQLGIDIEAVHLRRTVEMYQFVTREDKTGKVTTELKWSSEPEPSSAQTAEQLRNPPMPFRSAEFSVDTANAGPFRLSSPLIDRMTWYAPVDPATLAPTLGRPTRVEGDYLYIEAESDGATPLANQIGDLRVRVEAVFPQPVSLVAQVDGRLLSVPTVNGETGYAVIKPGILGKSALIAAARSDVKVRTMAMRVFGLVMMIAGLSIALRGATSILLRVPLLGGALGVGIWIVAALAGLAIGFVTIALAWFAYRPFLSVCLLALAGAALALELFVLRKTRRSEQEIADDSPDGDDGSSASAT